MNDETDEKWLADHDEARTLAQSDGVISVEEMKLPLAIFLPSSINGLSERANAQCSRSFGSLEEEFGDTLPKFFAYSRHIMWLSCWDGAHWFRRSIELGHIGDTEYCRDHCTASGYAKTEGWAYATFNKLAEINFFNLASKISKGMGLKRLPRDDEVLEALELVWLHEASQPNIDRATLLEMLHEAGEAGALANGLRMWASSEKLTIESLSDNSEAATMARRVLAKAAANVRHAPTNAIREQVISRYRGERAIYSRKDSAAIAYTKDYAVEFTTIRNWLKGI